MKVQQYLYLIFDTITPDDRSGICSSQRLSHHPYTEAPCLVYIPFTRNSANVFASLNTVRCPHERGLRNSGTPHTAAPIRDRRRLASGTYSVVNYVDTQLISPCTCKGARGRGVWRGRGRVVPYRLPGFPRLLSKPHSSMPKDSVSLIGMGPIEYNTPGDMKLLVRFRLSPYRGGVGDVA